MDKYKEFMLMAREKLSKSYSDINKRKIVIWGASRGGEIAKNEIEAAGLYVERFVDKEFIKKQEFQGLKVEDINSNITSESNPPAEAANSDTPNTEGTQTQGEGESQQQETAENDPVQTEQPPSGEENQASQTMSEAQIYLDQGYYIVEQGDSLVGICRKIYQTSDMLDKICEINGIDNPDAIYAGQYLALPN